MKKVLSVIAVGLVFIGGLIFTMNKLDSPETTQVTENTESSIGYNGPKLHWMHEDKYPTAEQLTRFHTHKGQFPLETAELTKQN